MNIPTYLKRNNIRASAFARMIGVSRGHVSAMISGIRRPSPLLAIRIECKTGGAIKREDLRPDLFKRAA